MEGVVESKREEQTLQEARRFMFVLRPAMLVVMSAGTATMQARQLLVSQTVAHQGPETVTMATKGLATAFSVGSLIEFFISPIYGKISETFGRKPLFLGFLIGPAISRMLCVLVRDPSYAIPMLWADFAGARFLGLQPTVSVAGTMISDLFPVSEQPAARAQLQATQSLGQIIGNYASGYLNAVQGPRITYSITAAVPAATFLVLAATMSESHQRVKAGQSQESDSNSVTITGKAKSPFITLLGDIKAVSAVVCIGLYEFMSYPAISTVAIMFMKDRLSWGPLQAGRYAAGHALAVFTGSLMSTKIQNLVGKTPYVTLAHLSMSLAYLLWGTASTAQRMLISLFPMALGSGAKEVLITTFVQRAANLGMGKGEAGAIIQAMGAATRIIAPQLFMRLYLGSQTTRKRLGAPMMLVSAVALLQELLFRCSLASSQ
eukprot:TRINITY_DN47291_c0_g1_i1.p1 TRINITY_DN47291_c0_g1~~TRINITY_DN47291_c0_g1_i1.p1  ORF type:complete len:433 (+),score=41.93 TRINITY_DN47291_c0_g1_i1:53-1351(+)